MSPVLILTCCSVWAVLGARAYRAMPCCPIQYKAPDEIPSIFNITRIFITHRSTCANVCVSSVMYRHSRNSTALTPLCTNGFSLMTFLLTVLQRLGDDNPYTDLRGELEKNLADFIAHISAANTDSFQFSRSWPFARQLSTGWRNGL